MDTRKEKNVAELSLDEAISEREILVRETMDIQTDLGSRNRIGQGGVRMNSHQYWDWRSTATYTLRDKQRRMADLKEHIKKLRQSVVNNDKTLSLLSEAHDALHSFEPEDLDPNEMDLLRKIEQHLKDYGYEKNRP